MRHSNPSTLKEVGASRQSDPNEDIPMSTVDSNHIASTATPQLRMKTSSAPADVSSNDSSNPFSFVDAETSEGLDESTHARLTSSIHSLDSQSSSPVTTEEVIAEIGEVDNPENYTNGVSLLPAITPELINRKCLVLDLDETLVHSSFKYIWNADFVIPVEIEGTVHEVYVAKRPGVDEFLKRVNQLYEVVVFTASVAKYGDPLLNRLDPQNLVHHRLFRESCFNFHGNYIKNLSWLGRDLRTVVIVDNSPAAYVFQPRNAVPVSSWFSDIHDNELMDMLPFLEDLASSNVPNIPYVLETEW